MVIINGGKDGTNDGLHNQLNVPVVGSYCRDNGQDIRMALTQGGDNFGDKFEKQILPPPSGGGGQF